MRRAERHFAMLRAILSDYQDVISGPDVQRGVDAVENLEAELRASRISYLHLWDWASRMPDAGFNEDDPRWDWWHRRPVPPASSTDTKGSAE